MATINHSHRGLDADINRTATSFRRERRVKILGVLGAMALGLGALLMFTGGSFYRSYSPAAEPAPAYEAPAVDQTTTPTTTTPTTPSDETTGAQGVTPGNAPSEANPAVSDRFKDMQVVDPVFDETHRPELTGEDRDTPTTETTDTPSNTPDRNRNNEVDRMPPAGYAR